MLLYFTMQLIGRVVCIFWLDVLYTSPGQTCFMYLLAGRVVYLFWPSRKNSDNGMTQDCCLHVLYTLWIKPFLFYDSLYFVGFLCLLFIDAFWCSYTGE